MKATVVLFLTLLVCSQAVEVSKYTSLKKTRSIITIMSQVQSKMNSNGPLNDIIDLLDGYFEQIDLEQKNHDALFEKEVKECGEEADFRAKEVQDGKQAQDQSEVTLDHCNTQSARAHRDLQSNLEEQQKTGVYLQNLINSRESEAKQFEADTDAYKYNSSAVDEAIAILQEIWSGQSEFIQLSRHANKMLKHAIQMRKVHKIAPLMAALAQLSVKQLIADEGELQTVLSLLQQFRVNVENDFKAKENAEHEAISKFNELKASTEDYLAHLVQAQQELEEEIKELEKCINNQTAISQSAAAKVRRNQDLLDSATNMCLSFADEYVSAAKGRQEETELLSIILQKCKVRYQQLSENVKFRGLQNKFDEYVNKSPYEHVDGFIHKQIEFNPNGARAAEYQRDQKLENLF